MDKVEYKIRADEIKALIEEGRYSEAVEIADTIDWKRVKSVNMLCKISDLYKINRRFQESKDVLLMAYDRHPTGRLIVYSLCELSIKMGELVQAVEYFKEFVRIAPRDTVRYILQYKLYEAQDVSLEERIAVLEEFKKHDYRERWAYELAYLYHRVGLTTECVEQCDEMFLWFGDGRYVMKALELKRLHMPLSPEQQDRYIRYQQSHGGIVDPSIMAEKDEVGKDETRTVEIKQPTKEIPPVSDADIAEYEQKRAEAEARTSEEDLGQTREFIPGQMSFAFENQEDEGKEPADDAQDQSEEVQTDSDLEQPKDEQADDEQVSDDVQEEAEAPVLRDPDEIVTPHISEIKAPTYDVSNFNTINLQETLAQGLKEVIWDDQAKETEEEAWEKPSYTGEVTPDTEEIFEESEEEYPEEETGEGEYPEESYSEEEYPQEYQGNAAYEEAGESELYENAEYNTGSIQEVFFDTEPRMGIEIKYGGMGPILGEEKKSEIPMERPLEEEVPGAVIHPNPSYQMHNHFEDMLSQESDGQISMAMEPQPEVEKQITGQISIAEYLSNWELYKKQQQQKQLEKVKQKVADVTGDMFADFDEKTKAGLQEKIEKAISDAIKNDSYRKASGRGDWSLKRDDVINAAVEEVMEENAVEEEPAYEETYKEEQIADTAEELIEEEPVDEAQTEYAQAEEPAKEPEAEKAGEAETLDEILTREADEAAAAGMKEVYPESAAPDTAAEEPASADEPERAEQAGTDAIESSDKEEPAQEISSKVEEPPEETKDASENADEAASEESEDAEDEDEPERTAPVKAPKEEKKKTPAAARKHIGNRELEERVRTMTPEEKELFGPYIHHKKSRRQIIKAIDNLSMDPFSGNAIVTGEEGAGTVNLAKGLMKAMQAQDANFSGKVAKITANILNKRSPAGIFDKLANGALIIQRAADMTPETVSSLLKLLQEENKGLVIVLEDTKEDMDRFLDQNPSLKPSFNARVDIEALDDDSLVAYARQYALEKGYAIDNLGILALHTRISERQTLDHDVTVSEVKDIVDDAIYFAEKRTVGHFFDILLHKRYDDNDMIILRESDFMHD